MSTHSHLTPETQIYDRDIRRHLAEDHGDEHVDQYRRMRSCLAAHSSYHPDHRVITLKGDMALRDSAKAPSESGTVEA